MCVLISSTTFVWKLLIIRRIERDIIANVLRASCKLPVIRVRFEWRLHFLDRFSKNTLISNFMKIRSVEAEFFHADGQKDTTKLVVAFRNFTNAPEKRQVYCITSPLWTNSQIFITQSDHHAIWSHADYVRFNLLLSTVPTWRLV
jgi:hypothetical protein